jgi:LAO/AO transport system ATPase
MREPLLERFHQGDRLALSRLLSLAARGQLEAIPPSRRPPGKPSRVVAITGSGGVGKSTLIGKLIEVGRQQGQTVAVLACDPQSPLSGGALLGDRFRMPVRPEDDGVFIRSLAAVSGRGAVADHLPVMVRLLEAFGFDVILIETVGAGQGDTAVRELVDVVVVLLQPETGDDLQWEKAGLLEVADIIAIHKADLPQAEHVEAQVRAALDLGNGQSIPVLRVSAKTGLGIEALWSAITACSLRRATPAKDGSNLLRLAQEALANWLATAQAEQHPALQQLLAQWQQGSVGEQEAVTALLQLVRTKEESRQKSPGAH